MLDILQFDHLTARLYGITHATGRGVTANILGLGPSDSGFESRRPDKIKCPYTGIFDWRDAGIRTRKGVGKTWVFPWWKQ